MPSYLERYKNGEYIAVWQELTTLNKGILEADIYEDAEAVARETMQRVRYNVELLHSRLLDLNYRFIEPESAYKKPISTNTQKNLPYIEQLFGILPLSVRMWYEMIGEVYFVGDHPLLATSRPSERSIGSDPFCCYIWEINENNFDSYLDDGVPPDAMDFSPDAAAKGGFSGASDSLVVSQNAMDGIVVYVGMVKLIDDKLILDVKEPYFVDYLRNVFLWGGFLGFEYYLDPQSTVKLQTKFPLIELSYLCEGLLEF